MRVCLRKQFGSSGMWENTTHGVKLCPDSFHQKVSIPRSRRVCWAVFSKEKPDHDEYFTIKRAQRVCSSWSPDKYASTVREFSGMLLYGTRLFLGRAYREGYRYVWFEYNA